MDWVTQLIGSLFIVFGNADQKVASLPVDGIIITQLYPGFLSKEADGILFIQNSKYHETKKEGQIFNRGASIKEKVP